MTQSKSCFMRQTIYCMQVYLLIIIRFTSLLCCRCCVIVWDNDCYEHYIMANYSMGKCLQCSYIWFIIEVTIRTWLILLAFISIIMFLYSSNNVGLMNPSSTPRPLEKKMHLQAWRLYWNLVVILLRGAREFINLERIWQNKMELVWPEQPRRNILSAVKNYHLLINLILERFFYNLFIDES